ncbi:hypothetical protein EXE53_31320 [Halorubrum sp. SD626R]|uniref:hypothetical protein n=1 Tax=Halorubrum sp. SD626R TaxID=1419722 RepID=UPI0010F47AE8|nr:hypothetical protein [Halorubrum sp. SD626R]TKX76543.1 hypothetical protein EXE53_31320 [Halorubrum sp. SD626R]
MPANTPARTALQATKLLLAGAVLLVAAMTFNYLPQPYSTWPAIGSIPVSPELVVPALLGFVVVVEAFVEQFSIASVCLAIFGGLTFLLGVLSLYTLYAVESGGVFFIGFFSIIAGILFAVGVLLHTIVRTERFKTASKEIIDSILN